MFNDVYRIVKKIPPGKVATYGQIATLLCTHDARKIGWALHANTSPAVPCHRVVNKTGKLAENFAFDGWKEQKRRLEAEGVHFKDDIHVDLTRHLWNTLYRQK